MTKAATTLARRRVVRRVLEGRANVLVVSGLGSPTWDVAAVDDDPLNFPLWGAMGSAAVLGLGLALAQPARRILVITGDGEMLMGLGSLATIGRHKPGNLAILVLDNECYGETGGQPSHTASGCDLAAIARAAGFALALTVADDSGIEAARQALREGQGPVFVAVKVADEAAPLVMPVKDGVVLKHRFRRALGFD